MTQVDVLAAALRQSAPLAQSEAADAFRALVELVIVRPTAADAPLDLEIRGKLTELCSEPSPNQERGWKAMVAPAGFEPATKGL